MHGTRSDREAEGHTAGKRNKTASQSDTEPTALGAALSSSECAQPWVTWVTRGERRGFLNAGELKEWNAQGQGEAAWGGRKAVGPGGGLRLCLQCFLS